MKRSLSSRPADVKPKRLPSWQSIAKRHFPDAAWIQGSGPFACVAYCNFNTTVSLSATLENAQREEAFINRFGCGGWCGHQDGHEIVALERGRA